MTSDTVADPAARGLRAGRRLIEVRGNDRVSWLGGLVTCDVKKLQPGQAQVGLIVGRKGKILTDVVIAAPLERELLWLDVDAGAAEEVREHLDHHLIMEDVELTVLPGAVALRRGDAPSAGEALLALRGMVQAAGAPGLIYAGEGEGEGADLYAPLRFVAGWPAFGVDYDSSFYPQEAGLEGFAVAFDKGCYLGQEVVFMLQARGKVKRRLALLQAASEAQLSGAVHDEGGREVGAVKSAHGARAFALLQHETWRAGTTLQIGGQPVTVLG